ncbi:hypothetical protein CDQ84_03685 [Clostridium thermosuccinogenes]|uniref:Methyltransferase n=1 Tax=Clostridium thermosuccinogenes TaxID=84032 RepID=A0A2K2FQC5_9CLOT|nr:class I SAM-dependent methyltransferase [Pseudoclostridium thermosuccinogenes]AUS95095.1 hypothetical protein CDO33_00695 [Pseudoclostridium thermosuccinogenes]PNT99185.1 hypothetical protein CDQ85_03685 [Pseudoclostridium thermosuccinogenes]PNU00988.1 hypothetical protein CDQ84_03685 [Pseudoclostridium thermosuccinogenes]
MSENYFNLISECRSCRSKNIIEMYKTEYIPVAGIYYDEGSKPLNIKSPMTLLFCEDCGLVQLKETISSNIYSDYNFSGNTMNSYKNHLEKIAGLIVDEWNIKNKHVFEVGASDGALLKYIADKGNNKVAGVEPSKKLCDYAHSLGIDLKNDYFNGDYIRRNPEEKYDCVVVRHVMEHIDDLNDIADSLRKILNEDGLLVVEVPDVEAILTNNLYSNIFHEHLNYFSQVSINRLFARYGFKSVYETKVNIHGGSLLVFYKLRQLDEISNISKEFRNKLKSFAENISKYYSRINRLILDLSRENKIIHGYGASHRTFILLGNAHLHDCIPIIYDSNPFLDNRRLNGFHSLVMNPDTIVNNNPDTIVVFATSYESEIVKDLREKYHYDKQIISLRFEADESNDYKRD